MLEYYLKTGQDRFLVEFSTCHNYHGIGLSATYVVIVV